MRSSIAGLIVCACVAAGEDPFAPLGLEAHGFASFGYLHTIGTDWLGETRDGSVEFWEAAVNATARPADRLRLGVQLFVRDLGRYDNGRPQLDWAYADWRACDEVGMQVGRIRFALGLYNEVLDLDAARTPIFLPPSIYALRGRDLYISTDGAKLYGFADLGSVGSLDYQMLAGRKTFDPTMGFATYFAELGLGETIREISMDVGITAMAHWTTPWDGIALRASVANVRGFRVVGATPSFGITSTLAVGSYLVAVGSLLVEWPGWTFAAEYERNHARGDITVRPFNIVQAFRDDGDAAYAAVTCHLRRWLEGYAAIEASWADATDRHAKRLYTGVLAVNLMPTRNWSIKAEWRLNDGLYTLGTLDAPAPDDDRWQVLALKTTVDF